MACPDVGGPWPGPTVPPPGVLRVVHNRAAWVLAKRWPTVERSPALLNMFPVGTGTFEAGQVDGQAAEGTRRVGLRQVR